MEEDIFGFFFLSGKQTEQRTIQRVSVGNFSAWLVFYNDLFLSHVDYVARPKFLSNIWK